ncbi:hypothetical protein [Aliiglaciecola sp. LCG003]|uniref:hypothetical protein n=1 Tax=Aliiglaciecola sp. LCG003 TaxID=3053655 RepID=UPI0025743FFA|nr:hypothetical protein [Aliiglaciecola sp. LCG003]WJG09936.1 hypothetical protein QR722_02565 [Aliiglaciecola sp. LCG003]
MQVMTEIELHHVSGGFELIDIGYAVGYGVGSVIHAIGSASYGFGVTIYEWTH